MLPFPPLNQVAVDQVVDVPDAEHHVELTAVVQAPIPDVAHHRDERCDAGARRDEHGVVRDRFLHHEPAEGTDRRELRPGSHVVEVVRHEPAFDDLDGFESCSLEIFVRQTAQLELTSPTFLALARLSAESSHAWPSPVPTTRSIFRQNDALYFSHHCRGTIGRTPKSEEVF